NIRTDQSSNLQSYGQNPVSSRRPSGLEMRSSFPADDLESIGLFRPAQPNKTLHNVLSYKMTTGQLSKYRIASSLLDTSLYLGMRRQRSAQQGNFALAQPPAHSCSCSACSFSANATNCGWYCCVMALAIASVVA